VQCQDSPVVIFALSDSLARFPRKAWLATKKDAEALKRTLGQAGAQHAASYK